MHYVQEFGTRKKVEVLVSDLQAKQIIDDILKIISTDSAYDGKIFIDDVAEAYDFSIIKHGA